MEIARAEISHRDVAKYYDFLSPLYWIISLVDNKPKLRGVALADARSGLNVLCVGFGIGEEISYFSRLGCKITGIDISKKMIISARKPGMKDEHNAEFAMADALNIPFRPETFDIVYSAFLLDLLDTSEIDSAVIEMRRVLRKGGRVVSVNTTFESGLLSRMLYYVFFTVRNVFCTRMRTRPIFVETFFKKAGFSGICRNKALWGVEAVSAVKQ